MKLNRTSFIGLFAGALVCGTLGVGAVPPPPPPGVVLAPGMTWCPRCGGHGRVPSGFLGIHDKRCPECKGLRMVCLRDYYRVHDAPVPRKHPHHAAPPPPPKKPSHHGKKGGPR